MTGRRRRLPPSPARRSPRPGRQPSRPAPCPRRTAPCRPLRPAHRGRPGSRVHAHTAHTTARAMTTRMLRRRCRVTTPVRRRTAQGRQTTAATTRATAATHAPHCRPRAEGVVHEPEPGLELAAVGDDVERAVEHRERAQVEDLEQGDDAEDHPDGDRHGPRRATREDQGGAGQDDGLHRDPQEGAGGEPGGLRRRHQCEPDERTGQHGGGDPDAPPRRPRPRVRRAPARPVAPQPPHVAPERLGEQGQGDHCDGPPGRVGKQVGDHHREHDADDRGHDLAPVPELQRPPQPGQQPAGGAEGVADDTGRKHPPADRGGGRDAEHEDEEGVDLAVEPARRTP